MSDKVTLSLPEIARRLKQTDLPDVDCVVGIATGGVVPAALVAFQLERPLALLPINFRAEDNAPRHDHPVILGEITLPERPQRILLVDDVSVSGETLAVARRYLTGHDVTTLAMKGQADIVLFPEVAQCVNWPWKVGEAVPAGREPVHDFGQ